MSQGDGFTGGFVLGAVVGGIVGGVIGTLLASQRAMEPGDAEASLVNPSLSEAKTGKARRRQLKESDGMESSRRSLEDKIAQLNATIDEVRLSLGTVNGNALEKDQERSLTEDS